VAWSGEPKPAKSQRKARVSNPALRVDLLNAGWKSVFAGDQHIMGEWGCYVIRIRTHELPAGSVHSVQRVIVMGK
jgi:hypothetical protein